jgi:hypothetical protein
VPLAGALIMAAVFVKAFHDYSQTGAGYAKPILGIQVPIVIGIGSLLLGVVVLFLVQPAFPEFFRRRPEVAAPGTLERPVEHAEAHLWGGSVEHEHEHQGA